MMHINQLFSRAANYLAYQWNLSNAIPSRKVQAAMEAEGWTFRTADGYPSTIIDHPDRFGGQGLEPIDVIPSEMAISVMRLGDPRIVEAFDVDKRRLAAKVYGIS